MWSGLRKNGMPTRLSSLLSGLCFWAAGAAQLVAGSDATTRIVASPPRLGISDKVVYGVNLNDARAAMMVWTREIMKTIDINVVLTQEVVKPSNQLLAAIRGGTVDLFCLTAQEYRQVAQYVDTSRIIADDFGGDELLLVVREGSGIVNLAGLRGRSVILQESPNTGLAEPWLTVSLWREGLESPAQSLSRMTRNTKLSQVVLPVFFGQADACVVTRRALNTMFELNPQLSRKLKILLVSPRMVSAFFAWHKDYAGPLKRPLFDRLVELQSSPATRQILTLFQSSGFTARDADCLRPATSLLEAYERRRDTQAGRLK